MMLAPEPGGVPFTVERHTDASDGAAVNEDLSLRRVRSADYLVRSGVSRSQLAICGLGETDLLPGVDPMSGEQRQAEFVRRFQGGGPT